FLNFLQGDLFDFFDGPEHAGVGEGNVDGFVGFDSEGYAHKICGDDLKPIGFNVEGYVTLFADFVGEGAELFLGVNHHVTGVTGWWSGSGAFSGGVFEISNEFAKFELAVNFDERFHVGFSEYAAVEIAVDGNLVMERDKFLAEK